MSHKINTKERIFAAIVLVMILCCIKFGTWQISRLHWKENLINKFEESKVTPPAPLDLNNFDNERDLFKRITAEGHFLNNHELYLGGKYLNESREKDEIGVHVITPFLLNSGEIVLVNRGWVPQDKRNRMDRPESTVDEEITLEGMVRESKGNPPWYMPANMPGKNVWFWLDIPTMSKYLEKQGLKNVHPVLIQQTNMTVESGSYPKLISTELHFYNEHLTYVWTWFLLAGALIVMLAIWFRKIKKDRHINNIQKENF